MSTHSLDKVSLRGGDGAEGKQVVLDAFRGAAAEVPAYARILAEDGVDPDSVCSLGDFQRRVPVLDKHRTFGRFSVADLCRGGDLGRPAAVVTSSGHSGLFSYGLYEAEGAKDEARLTDDLLDMLFQVRSRPTLMINTLAMGVRIPTRSCTLGETSVRADMATALVKQFARQYQQVILVGETAFVKHVLELGQDQGIDWKSLLVHVIVGEELLAENARIYVQQLLGCSAAQPGGGLVGSSMGVAEMGPNLFFELPPLIKLRRTLHEDASLRQVFLGTPAFPAPMLFAYDPRRIFVEVDRDGGLVISTLDRRRLPLIRYRTGDFAALPSTDALALIAGPDSRDEGLAGLPIVMVHGRGQRVLAGGAAVFPEQVKEGLYHDPSLARLTTANFRLASSGEKALVRIQLSPSVASRPGLVDRFEQSLRRYVPAPLKVSCEEYERFTDGMCLDYERKFAYVVDSQAARAGAGARQPGEDTRSALGGQDRPAPEG